MSAIRIFFYVTALAISAFASAQEKATVIYFGGWGATSGQIDSWQTAANRSNYKDSYKFIGVPWPLPLKDGWDEKVAIRSSAGQALISIYVNMIYRAYDANPNKPFIIAGHSSGSPMACAVIQRLSRSHPQPDYNVKFADLDGFNCDKTRFKSLCVAGLSSPSNCTKNIRAQMTPACANGWIPTKHGRTNHGRTNPCYHFSIVNSSVRGPMQIANGYDRVRPNLIWLDTLDGESRYSRTARAESGPPQEPGDSDASQ